MSYFVAAYTLSPSSNQWNPQQESEYYSGLKKLPNLRGLEIPVVGGLHAHDKAWFLDNIDPHWQFVFTGMPGVMAGINANPNYGIASNDERGRLQALDFYKQSQLAVLELNQALGREAVESIQLHTAPNRKHADASSSALQASLIEMSTWDWGGAQLVVEHCDAMIESQPAQKGFLSLEEEIEAIETVNAVHDTGFTLAINWGRSAIETRSADGPIKHIQQVNAAGLLSGLTFSGASDKETAYGVWKDSHMPPAHAYDLENFAKGSLLTADEMIKSLVVSDHHTLPLVGLKIGVQPAPTSVEARLAYYRDALSMLEKAHLAASSENE